MSPSTISFIKAIGVVVIVSVLTYVSNAANLTGIVPMSVATIIAAIAAALETHLKEQSGNNTALFGTVRVR